MPSRRLLSLLVIAAGAGILVWSTQPARRTIQTVLEKAGLAQSTSPTGSGTDASPHQPAAPDTPAPSGPPAILSAQSADEILRLINEYRASHGLPPIVKNDRFCEFANVRAREVVERWDQRQIVENKDYYFRAVCLKCKRMAELLARNVTSPQEVVNNWLDDAEYQRTITAGYNIGCVGGYSPDQVNAYIALELGERVEGQE